MPLAEPLPDPAPYALPPGVPALENPPRRLWAAAILVLAFLAAAAAGWWLGQPPPPPPPAAADFRLDLARERAAGPLADLLRDGAPYLRLVHERPSEPTLWPGVARLARAAITDPEAVDPATCVLLEDAIRSHAPPAVLPLGAQLAARRSGPRPGGD